MFYFLIKRFRAWRESRRERKIQELKGRLYWAEHMVDQVQRENQAMWAQNPLGEHSCDREQIHYNNNLRERYSLEIREIQNELEKLGATV